MQINLHVPDMTCNHCKMRIEKSLSGLENIESVTIDLDEKIVHVSGDIDKDKVIDAIKDTGYTVSES